MSIICESAELLLRRRWPANSCARVMQRVSSQAQPPMSPQSLGPPAFAVWRSPRGLVGMKRRYLTAVTIAAAVIVVTGIVWWGVSSPETTTGESTLPNVASTRTMTGTESVIAGRPESQTLSCAARGCHGAVTPSGNRSVRQIEYTIWAALDPHARAYEALRGEQARRIIRNLIGKDEPATKYERCLACHASARPVSGGGFQWNPLGVGCESCHGQPEPWLNQHHGWAALSPEKKHVAYNRHRMTWLGSPTARAQVSVGCHVGSADAPLRDVDHALIAAGHPPMEFELNEYLQALPRHWIEGVDPLRVAKTRAAGQIASARTWLKLLCDRATRVPQSTALAGLTNETRNQATLSLSPPRLWPEFSEMNCYGCHHDLRATPWPIPAGAATPAFLGRPTWGNVYAFELQGVARLAGWSDDETWLVAPRLHQLADQLRSWSPSAAEVKQTAEQILIQLDAIPLDPDLSAITNDRVAQSVNQLLDEIEATHPRDRWRLIQRYLTLMATLSVVDRTPDDLHDRMQALARRSGADDPLADVHKYYSCFVTRLLAAPHSGTDNE